MIGVGSGTAGALARSITANKRMAVGIRGGKANGIVFHSDRGSQYLSANYQQKLANLGIRPSVGRTGVCWDNAVAESLWSSLKRELLHRYRWPTRAAARPAIFAWIQRYNRHRLHSSLGYLPPIEYEQQYHHTRSIRGPEAA
ncbi:integrase core domain-containing protein [Rhodococcus erythropolis]|uniref:integrase core domain-containing protein n=1 Tax=Rhodococcus erythropolis TaxID=1833 RepID=UPI00294A2DF2|nr:integrase core domain-containing protein [Rhodococcus erythropolis]MDV6277903.1 integrase core domain-containing protein [Rhodococcus erythropolis]